MAPQRNSLAHINKTWMGRSNSNNVLGILIAWPWKCRRRQSDNIPLGWRRVLIQRRSLMYLDEIVPRGKRVV